MEVRLITVREDFEKAYNILNQKEYPLSFYEYSLKHDNFHSSQSLKLIGVFEKEECIGTISYHVTPCTYFGKILEIKEMHQTTNRSYKQLMDFLDVLARDENCQSIKISKNKIERLEVSLLDRIESYLRKIIH